MAIARDWRPVSGTIGHLLVGLLVGGAVACGRGDRTNVSAADSAAGEVKALDYQVTNDRYEKWLAAQQALDATPGLPAPPPIDPMHLGEPELQRAISYLEGDPRARAALDRAGISARDYVLTTVALDQALVASKTSPSAPTSASNVSAASTSPSSSPARAAPSSGGASAGGPGRRSGATPRHRRAARERGAGAT
jgi:hypothetical protein